MCGDWSREDIYVKWPQLIADELSSFVWPIVELTELDRLFACEHAQPVSVCGGEFTAACRDENERQHHEVTLSVDRRKSLVPGVHACLDMRLVLHRKRWQRAYLFPPCTHQTLSDTIGRPFKEQDGRMFFYILFVIWCYCTPALMLLTEQPRTRIPDFFINPTQIIHTSEMGDEDDKVVCLYERGRSRLRAVAVAGGTSGHGQLFDYADAEARDRWRSSWRRFPLFVQQVVAATHFPDGEPAPSFSVLRESFAVQWHRAGLPVPHDYNARGDALPLSEADRAYLDVRGPGDGRVVKGVVPLSLRDGDHLLLSSPSFEPSAVDSHQINLREVTAQSILLCFVAMQTIPLIFACLNGFTLLGAHLEVATPRGVGLAIATRWAEHAIQATSSTFLVGEYRDGARLFTAPLNYHPPASDVVRTPAERRARAKAGATFAWCTLAALAGCMAYDPAGRAAAACAALRGPINAFADAAVFGHPKLSTFSVGVFAAAPMVDLPDPFPFQTSSVEQALRRDWNSARWLKEALLKESAGDEDLGFWAEKIQPPRLEDIPPAFLENMPTFDDGRLALLPFAPDYSPPRRPRLLIKPPQPPLPKGRCVRTVFDLMPDRIGRRLRAWLWRTLEDLICMRDLGVDCERHAPSTLVIGSADLYEWARHHVYDFRLSPHQCAVALDYAAPLNPTLHAEFFNRELADYPNQQLLGMINTGVIYMADVEAQSVFMKHLISLPKGYKAVAKELRRLKGKGWYDFTPHIPFWPIYFNSQGSTARKLEPDRDRRTTEGGGPRQDTWDSAGIKVLSINEASRIYHVPEHYWRDTRLEFRKWMASRHLPPSAEDLAALELTRGSKWGVQHMPDMRMLSSNLAVLAHAARLLGEPLYLFGNDIKDFFNHLENSPSELPLMNIVFLSESDDLTPEQFTRAFKKDGEALVFVSERRMGFGIHPNSGIAQELSEAIDYIFRKQMDAVEDPLNEADVRPAMQRWLSQRRELERKVGGHQRRLYTSLTFCDDNIIGVVGVRQAIRAIKVRRGIEREAGLIMAIPEKRMLGTWGLWLGILIFSQLGFILVPKAKLLRASQAVVATINSTLAFDDYRSLCGLLEHIRHALFLPRSVMHGLYFPHGPHGEGRSGPSTIVQPNSFMTSQLQRWCHFLSARAGSYFTAALRRVSVHGPPSTPQFYASSDAATDSQPPGLGGYMHGMYWYLALSDEMVRWLHISVLELLATGFSTIIFTPSLPPNPDVRLTQGADASATATTLTRQTERSNMLQLTHHALLDDADFARFSCRADLGQLRGDANLASDAVSRGLWDVFAQLCQNLRIRPVQLPVPPNCLAILQRVLAMAKATGVPVRPNPYVSTPTQVPEPLLHLVQPPVSKRARLQRAVSHHFCGRCGTLLPAELFGLGRCPSCVDYDGPPQFPVPEGIPGVGDDEEDELLRAHLLLTSWPPESFVPYRTTVRAVDYNSLAGYIPRRWGPFTALSDEEIMIAENEILLGRWLLSQVLRLQERIDNIIDFAQSMFHDLRLRGVRVADLRRLEQWSEFVGNRRLLFASLSQAPHIASLRPLHTPLIHELMRPTYDSAVTAWEPHSHRQMRVGRNSSSTPCSFTSTSFQFVGEGDDEAARLPLELMDEHPFARGWATRVVPGHHRGRKRYRESSDREDDVQDVRAQGVGQWFHRAHWSQRSDTQPVIGTHSSGFLCQEVYQFAAPSPPLHLGELANALAGLRATSDKWIRLSHLDSIARLYGVRPCAASRAAVALVVVCLDTSGTHMRACPQYIRGVPQSELDAWHARLAACPHVSAALTLCALGIGREFSSDSMGDGPGRYAAALHAASLAPVPSSLFTSSAPPVRAAGPAAAPPPVSVPLSTTTSEPLSRLQVARLQSARPRRSDGPPVMPTSMQSVMAGGQRYAAAPDRHRLSSKRKHAMLQYAHERASSMAPSSATLEQREQLLSAVLATHELAEYGSAVGTLEKDDRAWEFWERFCKLYGWEPVITAEFARTQPMEISQRLAIFQAWVYPQLKGLKQADAKPRSVFNGYVLAILRILNREHVPMPKAKHVEKSLNGIMRAFKDIYGHEALMPGRKQPFTPAMWARIESLAEGTSLSGRPNWSPASRYRDRNLLRLGRVLWSTGHRLGEIVWHPSGEINYTTRACVSISKADSSKIACPSAADWRGLQPGDCVMLAPSTSKSDQFGEEHCPFPSILPYDGRDDSAAAAIRDIELESPCPAQRRRKTPLFSDEQGHPFSYSMLHGDLRALLTALFGRAFAMAFSWHSVRIGLACALHAADCPDAVIQLICRWASPDSLKVYRQMGIEKNIYWVDRAHAVTFDATRVNNLPALDHSDSMLVQAQVFGDLAVSDTAMPPTPVRRPVRTFTVPGGTVQAFITDTEGLVGLGITVPRAFWSDDDLTGDEPARIPCVVAAECVREFRHPDHTRTHTYLISWGGQYFPIKRESLVRVCLSAAQRAHLGLRA